MTPTTPIRQNNPEGSIKDSIAALRSILMIDTPTKSLLSPSVEAQQSRAQKLQQWDEVSKLRHATTELKHQIQEVAKEAAQEVRKRKTLQTTYDALAKHKRELSLQLEIVNQSREATEKALEKVQKTLQEERSIFFKERSLWKPEIDRLTRENKKWSEQVKTLETRCAALEETKQQLSAQIKTLESKLAEAEAKMNSWESSQAIFQPALEQAEKARQTAEAESARVQQELEVIKRRHQKSLASLLDIQQSLKTQLQQVRQEKLAADEQLNSTLQELENVQAIAKKQEVQYSQESGTPSKAVQDKPEEVLKLPAADSLMEQTELQEKKESLCRLLLEGVSGDFPEPVVVLDHLIRNSVEMLDTAMTFAFVQELGAAVTEVKRGFLQLQQERNETEAKLTTRITAEKAMEYDLALSREQLREVRDQLLESREEADQLRAELATLQSEVANTSGGKRSLLEHQAESELDADEAEGEDIHEYDSKRRKGDDYFRVADV